MDRMVKTSELETEAERGSGVVQLWGRLQEREVPAPREDLISSSGPWATEQIRVGARELRCRMGRPRGARDWVQTA